MLRSFAVAVAFLAFALPAAHAKTYDDPQGRFSVNIPDGWTTGRPTHPEFVLAIGKEEGEEKRGICLVSVKAVPEMASAKQSEIDEAFTQIATKEFWEAAFKSAGATDVTVESAGNRDQDGRKVFYVVVTLVREGIKVRGKQNLHAIPGSLQFINCAARDEIYAEFDKDFESIFESYKAKSGDYVAQAPKTPPSVLTLYTGAKFDGTARVLATDTPNVGLLGLASAPSSVAIAGLGQWEICDGVNYTGTCQVVAAGASSQGSSALRVGSVRRYISTTKSVTGLGGVASAAAGVLSRATVDQLKH
jgi:hypothetical protein